MAENKESLIVKRNGYRIKCIYPGVRDGKPYNASVEFPGIQIGPNKVTMKLSREDLKDIIQAYDESPEFQEYLELVRE